MVWYLIILWFILCFIVANSWRKKGLSYGQGFAITLFFSPFIGILIGILLPENSSGDPLRFKVCPQCKEYIKIEANVCKYCGYKFKESDNLDIAEKLAKAQNYTKAANIYEEYIKNHPEDPEGYYRLATLYNKKEDYNKTIEYCLKAIERKPDYAEAYYILGTSYYEKDDIEKAIEYLKKAIEIKPDYKDAYLNLGIYFSELEKYKEALETYEKYIELNPEGEDIPDIKEEISFLKKKIEQEKKSKQRRK